MKIHSFSRTQIVPAEIGDVWNFFSSPSNLAIITPSKMNFRIIHNSDTSGISQGQIIRYKINVIPFLTTHWTTKISQVDRSNSFTDVQVKGPYSLWEHHHRFVSVPDGVLMTDEIRYAIPYGWLGRLANTVFVRRELNAIFEFRSQAVTNYFLNKKNL